MRTIENFVNALNVIVKEQNYELTFQRVLDKIHQYPTCDTLIYSTILYLEKALYLYNVLDPEPYKKVFESLYKRLVNSDIQKIRDTSISMLISYTRNAFFHNRQRKTTCYSLSMPKQI